MPPSILLCVLAVKGARRRSCLSPLSCDCRHDSAAPAHFLSLPSKTMDWKLSFLDDLFSSSLEKDAGPSRSERYIVILLNGPLPTFTYRALRLAEAIVCVDGGTDRLLTHLSDLPVSGERKNPVEQIQSLPAMQQQQQMWVIGDCDSVRPSTLEELKTIRLPVIRSTDVDTTDLQKSLYFLSDVFCSHLAGDDGLRANTPIRLVILGGYGGRTDHFIGNLNALYESLCGNPSPSILLTNEVYLVDDTSLCCVLKRGANNIHCSSPHLSVTCGLLPLLPVHCVTSTGLKWNVKGASMSIGALISVSNQRLDELVTVNTSDPLVWYCEVRPPKDADGRT